MLIFQQTEGGGSSCCVRGGWLRSDQSLGHERRIPATPRLNNYTEESDDWCSRQVYEYRES
eukprot:scaffold3782_cov101-Alexandrium_tamarense.AAC.1